jgi:hypothetical protein
VLLGLWKATTNLLPGVVEFVQLVRIHEMIVCRRNLFTLLQSC